MKNLRNYLSVCALVICTLFTAVSFSSCSDDDEGGGAPDGFCGTYCHNYQNRLYRYYTFYENGTGRYSMEGNVSYHEGTFTYSFSGNKVTCKGKKTGVWNDGSVDTDDINVTFKYTNGHLVTDSGDVFEKIN